MMAKSIIEKEEADNIAVTFTPKKFPMRITENALSFHKIQIGEKRNDFRIDQTVSVTTGVGELERLSIEEKVERQALAKVKEIQEEAYREAFKLGIDEGKIDGFEQYKIELTARIETFEVLLFKIENLKTQLVGHNEAFLMKLLYQMAGKIAMTEITNRPEVILEVLKQTTEQAQSDQKVTVKLAPDDFKFISGVRDQLSRNFDFVKNLKLEESAELSNGGCKIETNFGSINATVEQRVEELWKSIFKKTPRTKDDIGDGT